MSNYSIVANMATETRQLSSSCDGTTPLPEVVFAMLATNPVLFARQATIQGYDIACKA